MSNRKRAEDIIDNYAWGHAGTAFVVGHLGGQFGADRIPLTILTTKMILDLCDLYGVENGSAKRVHIGATIARLTVKGTVLAHTILNWIPLIGPGANSFTTFHLTKNAGKACMRDLEAGRMTTAHQVAKGLLACVRDLLVHDIQAGFLGDAMENVSEEAVDAATEAALESGNEFIENVVSEIPEAGREAAKGFLASLSKNSSVMLLDGGKIEVGALRDAALRSIVDGLLSDAGFKERTNIAKISIYEDWLEILPSHFQDSLTRSIDACAAACGKAEQERAVAGLIEVINSVVQSTEEIASLVKDGDLDADLPKTQWAAEAAHQEWIVSVYRRHGLALPGYANRAELIGQCGKAYAEIHKRHVSQGYWMDMGTHEHDATWFMAEWLRQNRPQGCSLLDGMRTAEVAGEIFASMDRVFRREKTVTDFN